MIRRPIVARVLFVFAVIFVGAVSVEAVMRIMRPFTDAEIAAGSPLDTDGVWFLADVVFWWPVSAVALLILAWVSWRPPRSWYRVVAIIAALILVCADASLYRSQQTLSRRVATTSAR